MLGLSQTTGYAILALACMEGPDGDCVQVREISGRTGIKKPYLSKLVHALGVAGLVESRRGHKGGVRLSREARRISILEIVEAVDGPHVFDRCLMGMEGCSDIRACPAHSYWKPMRTRIRARLASTTLESVACFERERGARVAPAPRPAREGPPRAPGRK